MVCFHHSYLKGNLRTHAISSEAGRSCSTSTPGVCPASEKRGVAFACSMPSRLTRIFSYVFRFVGHTLGKRNQREAKKARFIFSARFLAPRSAQCGVDLVDTNRRANEPGPAEDYLRYFTEHFTDTEWETIKRQVRIPPPQPQNLRVYVSSWVTPMLLSVLGGVSPRTGCLLYTSPSPRD